MQAYDQPPSRGHGKRVKNEQHRAPVSQSRSSGLDELLDLMFDQTYKNAPTHPDIGKLLAPISGQVPQNPFPDRGPRGTTRQFQNVIDQRMGAEEAQRLWTLLGFPNYHPGDDTRAQLPQPFPTDRRGR